MSKISILKIIPLEELSFKSPDYFVYFSTFEVNKGAIVKCGLKNKEIYGYVYEKLDIKNTKKFLKEADYQIKNLKEVYLEKPFISSLQENLAQWLSRNYGISLAHSFYFFLSYFRKIKDYPLPFLEKEKQFKKIYLKEINNDILKDRPILIITSTEAYAKYIYEKLKKEKLQDLILLDLDVKKEKFNEFINSILKKEKKIYIGSKKAIFLPWQKLKTIIVYKEGDIFYKEYFKIPYFNYINIIEKLAKLLKTKLIVIDKFPSLKTIIEFNIENPIEKIDFDRFYSIFELNHILEKYRTVKIFVPTKLTARRLICATCLYEFQCPRCNYPLSIYENSAFCRICFKNYKIENNCPHCGSNDFFVKGIGANWLKKYLEKEGYFVYIINKEGDIKNFLKENYRNYILIGSLYILNPFLPKTDVGIFINFDLSFHSSNPFLKEKYLRILNDLKNSANDLYLHSNLPKEVLEKIKNFDILKEIIEEREFLKLPPFYKVIKLVSRLKNLEELNKRLLLIKERINKNKLLQNIDLEVYGPFLERLPMKIKRFQLFLLLKTKEDINLKKLLENIDYIEEIKADEEEI